jgi:hypothetical protein
MMEKRFAKQYAEEIGRKWLNREQFTMSQKE